MFSRRMKLGAVLATVVASVFIAVQPAHASNIFGCRNDIQGQLGQICVFDWIDYNQGGAWTYFSFDYADNVACRNLSDHTWPTGGSMNNAISSVVINGYPQSTNGTKVTFYDWVNCNSDGGWAQYWVKQGDALRLSPNLNSIQDAYAYTFANWYNRFTSFKVQVLIP